METETMAQTEKWIKSNFILATEEEAPEAKSSENPKIDIEKRVDFWLRQGKIYFKPPMGDVNPELPPGVYDVGYNRTVGFFVHKKTLNRDEVLELPHEIVQKILTDITTFWQRRDRYQKYGLIHKRGILMHGPAGCGKSYTINLLSDMLVKEYKGVVLHIDGLDSLEIFIEHGVQYFREENRNIPLIIVLEDLESYLVSNSGTALLLNILDGINQIDNVVFLGTTNYPERLEERILNRPSRFDRIYYFGLPDEKVRRFFIKSKLKEGDLEKIDLEEWVKKTEGFTLAHLREIIISTVVLGNDFEEVLSILRGMSKLPDSKDYKTPQNYNSPKIGFH